MKTSTFFALVASAEMASATFNWGGVKPFTCPGNTPVTCEESQKGGFNWSGLEFGEFSNFGGFQFSGYKCAAKFGGGGGKFQDKCITGTAGPDKSTSPKFSCGKSPIPNFSVDVLHITPEFDCDLQFHYTMPDKSTCKQTSKCSSSGTVVKNTQCGGATDVTIVYPGGGKGKPNKCNVGVHHIGFHCETPPKPTKSKTTTTKAATTSKPVGTTSKPVGTTTAKTTLVTSPSASTYTQKTTTPGQTTTSDVPGTTTTAPGVPGTTTTAPGVPGTTTTAPGVPGTTTTAPGVPGTTTTAPGVPGTTTTAPGVPGTTTTAPGVPGTTTAPGVSTFPPNDVTTTVITDTTVTTCPFTSTHISSGTTSIESGTTVSTIVITSTHTTCNKCTHQPTTGPSPPAVPTTSSPVGETPATSPPAVPTTNPSGEIPTTSAPVVPATSSSGTPSPPVIPEVPIVLPQCLSTWMFSSECADNTDASCYCKSSEYVCNVFDCLDAHATDAEVAQAQSYLQGICAPYIDVNSAIITCAGPPPPGAPQVPIVPSVPNAVTTIQIYTTIVVPCSTSGTAIPGSSTTSVLSTAVTVPQVVFETPAGSSSAALVVGTPAPVAVPAGIITSEAPAPPAATTLATIVPTNGTAAPTGSTEFTGASSQLTMTFGTLIGALMVSVFVM